MCREIKRLRKLCQKWGGDLIELSSEAFDQVRNCSRLGRLRSIEEPPQQDSIKYALSNMDFYEAPFTKGLGVDWKNKIIFYTGEVKWSYIIHEMGHVFASNKTPDMSEEWDFFGWEIAVARFIKARMREWRTNQADYNVPYGEGGTCVAFGGLTYQDQCRVMSGAVQLSTEEKLIRKGAPVSVRYSRKRHNSYV